MRRRAGGDDRITEHERVRAKLLPFGLRRCAESGSAPLAGVFRGKMASGGKSGEDDRVFPHMPLSGVLPDEPHRARELLERGGINTLFCAVAQGENVIPFGEKGAGERLGFAVIRKAVRAAGTEDYRRTILPADALRHIQHVAFEHSRMPAGTLNWKRKCLHAAVFSFLSRYVYRFHLSR